MGNTVDDKNRLFTDHKIICIVNADANNPDTGKIAYLMTGKEYVHDQLNDRLRSLWERVRKPLS
jgi:hypothetical protein